jgi:citrate synthase
MLYDQVTNAEENLVKQSRYLTAREAAETLDVSVATIYAYVSRGLIRSEPAGLNQRARLYVAEDVQKLLEQKAYRHDPAKVAHAAMQWGMPILESALTLIDETGLYYRGHDVTRLAITHTIEQVAALLWTGDMTQETNIFSLHPQVDNYLDALSNLQLCQPDLSVLQQLQIALTLAAADDLTAYDLHTGFHHSGQTGTRILKLITAVVAHNHDTTVPIARTLQRNWRADDEQTIHLFNAALILCADHELNASAFATRVVASAATHLYQAIIAGLAALQGFKHGGNTILVEDLFHEIALRGSVHEVIASRLRRGELIPGFGGHQLYPHGDPRAACLLTLLTHMYPNSPAFQQAQTMVAVMHEITGRKPNLEFALVALAQTLGLPDGSALALFATGRTVGWIGHAIEQYNSGQIIRPRAIYSGPRPDTPTR